VFEFGDGAAFTVEARENLGVFRILREQRFDRSFAHRRAHLLLGGVDPPHATFAKNTDDAITASDNGSEQGIFFGGRCWERCAAFGAKAGSIDVRVLTGGTLHDA
jgi:hypothetical protein